MINITNILPSTENTQPLTLESLNAAIDALQRPSIFPEGHPLHGVLEVKELAALKGSDIILISSETAYYHHDMLKLKEVKVLRLPDPPKPELSFSWGFTTTENL
jgi:hypothetical protein